MNRNSKYIWQFWHFAVGHVIIDLALPVSFRCLRRLNDLKEDIIKVQIDPPHMLGSAQQTLCHSEFHAKGMIFKRLYKMFNLGCKIVINPMKIISLIRFKITLTVVVPLSKRSEERRARHVTWLRSFWNSVMCHVYYLYSPTAGLCNYLVKSRPISVIFRYQWFYESMRRVTSRLYCTCQIWMLLKLFKLGPFRSKTWCDMHRGQ